MRISDLLRREVKRRKGGLAELLVDASDYIVALEDRARTLEAEVRAHEDMRETDHLYPR